MQSQFKEDGSPIPCLVVCGVLAVIGLGLMRLLSSIGYDGIPYTAAEGQAIGAICLEYGCEWDVLLIPYPDSRPTEDPELVGELSLNFFGGGLVVGDATIDTGRVNELVTMVERSVLPVFARRSGERTTVGLTITNGEGLLRYGRTWTFQKGRFVPDPVDDADTLRVN